MEWLATGGHSRTEKNSSKFVFVATTRLNLLLLSSLLRFSGVNHSKRFTFFGKLLLRSSDGLYIQRNE
ncbi:hypothetical protein SDJN03_25326, partial [Cucurbita argyrosperma subsp. sororia]